MDDPIIDEIYETRCRISAEFGHDPKRLVEHYMELEKTRYRDRMLKPPPPNSNPERQ
jgi:hypothetical protein